MNEIAGRDLTAFFSLYCGDCFGYKGKVAEIARDLRRELRVSKFKKFADYISGSSFRKIYMNYDI